MSRCGFARSPFTWIAILGAIVTLAGAIINWYQDGRQPLNSSLGIIWRISLFYDSLALLVPIFSLCAHLRRSPQLYAIALAGFIATFSNLVFLAHTHNKFVKGTSDANLHIGGLITELVGMTLSLAPLFSKLNGEIPSILINGISVCLWMISGAIFATQTNTGLLYNASWTALSFAFGALTFVSSYANYSSVVVALATAEIFALAQFVTALPASTHLLTAGFAIPFAAIIIHLTWITVDFTRRSVYDVMKRREEVEEDQGFELTAYPTRRTLTQRVYSLHANPIAWAVLGFVGVLGGGILNWYWDVNPHATMHIKVTNVFILRTVMALLVPFFTIIGAIRRAPQLFALALATFFLVSIELIPFVYAEFNVAKPWNRSDLLEYRYRIIGQCFQLGGMALALTPLIPFPAVAPRRRSILSSLPSAVFWLIAGILVSTMPIGSNTVPIAMGTVGIGFALWTLYASLWSSTSVTFSLITMEVLYAISWVPFINSQPHGVVQYKSLIAASLALAATICHLIAICVDFSMIRIPDSMKPKKKNTYHLIN